MPVILDHELRYRGILVSLEDVCICVRP